MFVVLIPVLTCLDLVIKYAINSMDNKDLPRNIAGKIEIDKFHNKGFPFGKLKENQRVFLTSTKRKEDKEAITQPNYSRFT